MTTHRPTCLPTALRGGVRAVGSWMPVVSLPRLARCHARRRSVVIANGSRLGTDTASAGAISAAPH